MKFNVSQKKFYKGINIAQRAVSTKNTMPILTGLYLEAVKDKGLHIIATNLELGIENWIEADIEEDGSIVLPAKNLTGIIRELPSEKINFQADLEHYQTNIKCLNSEFNFKGYNPEEFPQLPEINIPQKISFPISKLKKIIDEVKFSTSNDQTQPALTGVLMVIDTDSIKMISTNTYRLAYSKLNLQTEIEEEIKVILPGETITELSNLLEGEGKVEVSINSNYVSFNFNDLKVISRLIEGQFPNYNQVIPDEYNTKIKVKRDILQKAVKRASFIARLDSNIISLTTDNNKMMINSADSDTGHAHEEINIEINGPEQNINIDAGYLLDVLKVLEEKEVNIELIGPLNPLTVKKTGESEYIYLIMPVRKEA